MATFESVLQHPTFRRAGIGMIGGLVPTALNIVNNVPYNITSLQLVLAVCLGGLVACMYDRETDLVRLIIVGACAPALLSGFIANTNYKSARDAPEFGTPPRTGNQAVPFQRAPGSGTDLGPERTDRPRLRHAQFVFASLPAVAAQGNFCHGPPTRGGQLWARLFGREPVRIWITSRQSYGTLEAAKKAISDINKLEDLKNVSLPPPSILRGKDGYVLVYADGVPFSNMADELSQFAKNYSSKMAPWITNGYPIIIFDEDYMRQLVADNVVAPCA